MPFSDCLEKSDADVTVAKPALLVIGPTYSISFNRRKLRALAEYCALLRLLARRSDAHLAILGHGSLVQDPGFSQEPWITLLASRPHYEIAPFMQSLDLFILPSKPVRQSDHIWEEQFGHVLIEAMACGVPAIGSDSGAIREIVGEPLGIFRRGSADAIYEKLVTLLETPEALAAMGTRQRERVMQFYSHEAVACIYANFLRSI